MTTPLILYLDSEGGNAQVRHNIPSPWMIYPLPFPGRHAADASLWIGIATLLATLDFNAVKDADGGDIEFEATFANGITR